MKRLIQTYVDKLPYVRHLREEVRREGRYRAGHYYSPIPAEDDVLAQINSRGPLPEDLPDVDLQPEAQLALLAEYIDFYPDVSFPQNQSSDFRYSYPNYLFDYADAFFLYSFLRKHSPKRVVEVGSGYSSAVILDTLDRLSIDRPELTFIDPNPSRLESLLREDDRKNIELVPVRAQEASPGIFSSLETGDLLFLDSSHVVKCGSDVLLFFFEILPFLPAGIFVHFHDIFYPFDYPASWLKRGFYYNEAYCLRAFLAHSSTWSIYLFSSYADFKFGDVISSRMPLCAEYPGSSLYIRKEQS